MTQLIRIIRTIIIARITRWEEYSVRTAKSTIKASAVSFRPDVTTLIIRASSPTLTFSISLTIITGNPVVTRSFQGRLTNLMRWGAEKVLIRMQIVAWAEGGESLTCRPSIYRIASQWTQASWRKDRGRCSSMTPPGNIQQPLTTKSNDTVHILS